MQNEERFAFVPTAVAALGAFCVAAAYTWPTLASLGEQMPQTTFADSHVWGFDLVHQMRTGAVPMRPETDRAGFPGLRAAPVMAWAPAMMASILRWRLDPVSAFQIVWIAAPALAAVVAQRWLVRCGTAPWSAALLGIAWSASAPIVATMAAGNVDKAQVWVYPAWLLCASAVLSGGALATALGLVFAAVVGLAAAFTEPYLALFLPLFGGPAALWMVLRSGAKLGSWVRLVLLLAVTAGGMVPAQGWFRDADRLEIPRVFSPAPPPTPGVGALLPDQAPYAEPKRLVLPAPGPHNWAAPVHVVYVGFPLLVAALWASRRSPARGIGAVVAIAGALIAIGPRLIWDHAWVVTSTGTVPLPMSVLEGLGYPLSKGGQYYRAAPIVGLGLLMIVGPVLRSRLATVLLLVSLMDTFSAVRGAWPRPMRTIEGREAARFIAASPWRGAVLTLPLAGDQVDGGKKLLLAALHGRPTSSLPMHQPAQVVQNGTPWMRGLSPVFERLAGLDFSARPVLRKTGFAFVMWTPHGEDTVPDISRARMEALLGPPILVDGAVLLWSTEEQR